MSQRLILTVPGGTTHFIPLAHLMQMQLAVERIGAEAYPLLVRLGAIRSVEYQPVTARAVLAEVERLVPQIESQRVPTINFLSASRSQLGSYYGGENETVVSRSDDGQISLTPRGIRLVLRRFPPPVGFRSGSGLEPGWFECYFASLEFGPEGAMGLRTPAMGGSGAPVELPDLPPLPPVTRWHKAHVAGAPHVAAAVFNTSPAEEVFRDLIHAISAACLESLRLKRPLQLRRS